MKISCLVWTDAVLPAVISIERLSALTTAVVHKTVKCILQSRKAADMTWEFCVKQCRSSSVIVTYIVLLCTQRPTDWCIACESSSHVARWCLPLKQLNWILCSIVFVNVVTTHFSLYIGLISKHCAHTHTHDTIMRVKIATFLSTADVHGVSDCAVCAGFCTYDFLAHINHHANLKLCRLVESEWGWNSTTIHLSLKRSIIDWLEIYAFDILFDLRHFFICLLLSM